MISFPFIRKYNYIEDYFHTVYKLYAEEYVSAYPVTYYSINKESTIWDDDLINGGSYEKQGVGEWSGMKWRKIIMLPVFGVEQVNMNQTSDERGGMTFAEGMSTQIIFPSLYGLKPIENDVVDMSFGIDHPAKNQKNLYTITNINISHQGDYFQIYQCRLKVSPFKKPDLEKQVDEDWMFYEHNKIIVPLEKGLLLTQLQVKSVEITNMYNKDIFDNQSSFCLI
jgi:hypothetical protein